MTRLRFISGTLAGLLLGATLLPAADPPYLILFKKGGRIEARTAPVVKNGHAYFTTSSGQEFVVPADSINMAASEAENVRRRQAFASSGIMDYDQPIDASLGSLSTKQAQAQAAAPTAEVVSQTDLDRTSGRDLNSINPIAARTSPPAGNDQPATPDNGGSQVVTGPNGQTATINYQIQVNPQAPPASAPASEGSDQKP